MSRQTENSTEKSLEVISENNSVSVYSVNFTQVINQQPENEAEKLLIPQAAETGKSGQASERSVFSQKVFKWRNAIAVAAILVIGVLHFTFQISFQNEISENRPVVETPFLNGSEINQPARDEFTRDESAATKATGYEAKKTDAAPVRKNVIAAKPRQTEIVPAKPPIRKRAVVETRAERLRRVERILTGV